MRLVRRVVLDTGVLVSAALRIDSIPGKTLAYALRTCEICASQATLSELETVIARPKFDRYLDVKARTAFFEFYCGHVTLFFVSEGDEDALSPSCRDPKDDKFLALALACQADVIVSGDDDLLTLTPYQGIPILMPKEFLP